MGVVRTIAVRQEIEDRIKRGEDIDIPEAYNNIKLDSYHLMNFASLMNFCDWMLDFRDRGYPEDDTQKVFTKILELTFTKAYTNCAVFYLQIGHTQDIAWERQGKDFFDDVISKSEVLYREGLKLVR